MNKVLKLFKQKKPIIGLIHLKGNTDEEIINNAIKEIDIYKQNNIDGILVENYFGNYYHMESILGYLKNEESELVYGVNCLNMDVMSFDLANRFNAKFIQMDSVVGHLKPRDDYSLEAFLKKYRSETDACIFGGVRFKYQPILSQRSIEEDLKIGMTRCDAIVVTQDATGQETSLGKITEFRNIIGDFPLFVGAGMTLENCDKN